MVSAIIVAAGTSRRMGFDKLNADLDGKSVFLRCVEAFVRCNDVHEIICVCEEERFEQLHNVASNKPIKRADGGSERHFSVLNGLNIIDPATTIVAVHDGARPLISPQQISACIAAARTHQAAACARQITETIKRADAAGMASESIDRKNVWLMETPQCFDRILLEKAYQHVIDHKLLVTDEVSAVEQLGKKTFLVENPSPNPKITFPQDLALATHLLSYLPQ